VRTMASRASANARPLKRISRVRSARGSTWKPLTKNVTLRTRMTDPIACSPKNHATEPDKATERAQKTAPRQTETVFRLVSCR